MRRFLKLDSRFGGRLINCLGIRRDESAARAKRVPWRRNERLSVAGREVFDWLPIFELSTEDVFRAIRAAGQSPHWIYRHLSRCSCFFCIFSSPGDLRRAAELRPELYRRHVACNILNRLLSVLLRTTDKSLFTTRRLNSASATPSRRRTRPCRS